MKGKTLLIFLVLLAVLPAFAAWERVPWPAGNYMIMWMAFANAGLGYAGLYIEFDPNKLLVYRGGQWVQTTVPGLNAEAAIGFISLLPSGYGWLTADRSNLSGYTLYTWRSYGGGSWQSVPNPFSTPQALPVLCSRPAVATVDDVWFYLRAPTRVMRYLNGVWSVDASPFPAEMGEPSDIYFVGPSDGWVAGGLGFGHYNGSTWEYVPGPGGCTGLEFTATNDGWAKNYDNGTIYHYNGSSWSLSLTVAGYHPHSFGFYDRNNGWAAFTQYEATPKLFKFDAGIWHEVALPNQYGAGCPCPVSATEAWFVGTEYVKSYRPIAWHWRTEPSIEPTSLGKIKASFR